jgi:hypothetical protein
VVQSILRHNKAELSSLTESLWSLIVDCPRRTKNCSNMDVQGMSCNKEASLLFWLSASDSNVSNDQFY